MANQYTALGFDVRSADDLVELTMRLAPSAVPIETDRGTYLRWSSPSGAQLWLQRNRKGDFVGAHPHFGGTARCQVRVESHVKRGIDSALDGAFRAWMGDSYPFVVDCANYHEFSRIAPPAVADIQLCAFAREVETFESLEQFDAAQEEGELRYASQSFIPISLFGEEGEPMAESLFCGHVVDSAMRVNEHTGRSFPWMRVETLDLTVDVVADPEVLPSPPPAGSVIKGVFWLSAHVESMTTNASRWQRLRWKFRR